MNTCSGSHVVQRIAVHRYLLASRASVVRSPEEHGIAGSHHPIVGRDTIAGIGHESKRLSHRIIPTAFVPNTTKNVWHCAEAPARCNGTIPTQEMTSTRN